MMVLANRPNPILLALSDAGKCLAGVSTLAPRTQALMAVTASCSKHRTSTADKKAALDFVQGAAEQDSAEEYLTEALEAACALILGARKNPG